jgi:hypothetical protein
VFERFTERAREVIVLAQGEARILKHNYIGTEHLLLGLLREDAGSAASTLKAHGLSVEQVRAQVVRIIGSGEEAASGQIPFTPRAKKVLELSLREALTLGHDYIGTGHLLLGLLSEKEGVAVHVLTDLGADLAALADEVTSRLGEEQSAERSAITSAPPQSSTLDFLLALVTTAREADLFLHGNDLIATAYAAGAINALRESGLVSEDEARERLRQLQRPVPGSSEPADFAGRILERIVGAPEQTGDGFRVVAADLYSDGCVVRVAVPPGGTLPATIDLEDDAGTAYERAEPPDWHGSEQLLGEFAFTPEVPREAAELKIRAGFKDGGEYAIGIAL